MGKNKKKRLIKTFVVCFVVAILVLIIFITAQEGSMETKSRFNKVIIIGIDGFDPRVAKSLIAENKLPNLNKLVKNGTFINLNTSYPPHSPVAWTSIATGTNPGKHNIFDFIRRNPKNYLPELSLTKTVSGIAGTDYQSYVKADPFWRISSKEGISTSVIRWPVTFPPERIEGNLLSGLGVPDIKGFLSGYSYYTSEEDKESSKASNKIVKVEEIDGIIHTEIFGPKTSKSGNVVDIKEPLQISISNDQNSATLTINEKEYSLDLDSWSEWIRVKFKTGTFSKAYGIFRTYLISIDPFEMYVTAIQIDPENPIKKISYPPKYSEELAKAIGIYHTLGMPEETDGYVDELLDKDAFIKQIKDIENERNKMFWDEFNEFNKKKKGIFAFVFDSSDRLQHVMWQDKVLTKNSKRFQTSEEIEEYFIEKDEFIGNVLEKLDENTLLLIISDHGFTSFERSVSINTWLVENGFITLTEELKKGQDGALFEKVDWSKTKAYSVGFNSIYVNLQDREGKGIVKDRDAIIDEIIDELEKLKDPKTGKKVVNKAYKREEIYNGESMKDAPDIIIGFNPGFRMSWQNAIGGFTKEVITDNDKKWVGDHLVDPKFVPGVLFANIELNSKSASQMDIVPTIFDALGLKESELIDGKSLLK